MNRLGGIDILGGTNLCGLGISALSLRQKTILKPPYMETRTTQHLDAISRLYEETSPMLLAIFLKVNIPEEDARDLVQEVFVKILTPSRRSKRSRHHHCLSETHRLVAPPSLLQAYDGPNEAPDHRGTARVGMPTNRTGRAARRQPHVRQGRMGLQTQSVRQQIDARNHANYLLLATRSGGSALPNTPSRKTNAQGRRFLTHRWASAKLTIPNSKTHQRKSL